MTSHLAARLNKVLDSAIEARRIVGTVVLVARDGQLVYARGAGWSDREKDEPMREDAIFLLASVTKPLVTAAAMRLVEKGVLGLDDPVSRWLPLFRPRTAHGSQPEILVRHLLNHTAGLSYSFLERAPSPYIDLDISTGLDQPGLSGDENLRRLGEAPLAFLPGSAWRYSMAIDVLGVIVAKAAQAPLSDLVRRLVTGPLGMTDTDFAVVDRSRLVKHYADGRPEPVAMFDGIVVPLDDGAVTFAPSRISDAASYPSGGAGMAGTARDFLAFVETIRQEGAPILARSSIDAMRVDRVGIAAETQGPGWGFGYGWAVLGDPQVAATPQSEGTLQWGGAYGHYWFVDRKARLSVVALTNTAFEGMSGAFPIHVRDAVYGA